MAKIQASKNHLNRKKVPASMEFLKDGSIKLDKVLNKLDKFVLEFVKMLKKHAGYVIVSGYVSILFGRSRATEDIDLIVPKMSKKAFLSLFNDLSKGFECINSSSPGELYENYLCKDTAIRFSRKSKPIPNIEFKFAKTKIDYDALSHNICVKMGSKEIIISSIELQIAFKEVALGSDKDLEDAEHLKTVFEKYLNKRKLNAYRRMLKNG
jgi:hypothetical protein